MIDPIVFTAYNLVIGVITGLGILYFLFFRRVVVEYRQFLIVTISGLLLFLIGGPLAELIAPALVHWIHGIAGMLVVVGLYDPFRNDLRREAWMDVLLQKPDQLRQPSAWMLPIDEAILELFHSTDLVLTPTIIAYNIDYSREEVNRRLIELEKRGFVKKVERGKYRITALGREYLSGPIPQRLRDHLRYLWVSSDGPE